MTWQRSRGSCLSAPCHRSADRFWEVIVIVGKVQGLSEDVHPRPSLSKLDANLQKLSPNIRGVNDHLRKKVICPGGLPQRVAHSYFLHWYVHLDFLEIRICSSLFCSASKAYDVFQSYFPRWLHSPKAHSWKLISAGGVCIWGRAWLCQPSADTQDGRWIKCSLSWYLWRSALNVMDSPDRLIPLK